VDKGVKKQKKKSSETGKHARTLKKGGPRESRENNCSNRGTGGKKKMRHKKTKPTKTQQRKEKEKTIGNWGVVKGKGGRGHRICKKVDLA